MSLNYPYVIVPNSEINASDCGCLLWLLMWMFSLCCHWRTSAYIISQTVQLINLPLCHNTCCKRSLQNLKSTHMLSGFCCVSSVPASCVHIWFVSCPCFMSLWVNSCPAVCMWLCVNYPVYLVPVFWVWFRLVYSLLPGVSCL